MKFPFPIAFPHLFFVAALLLPIASCERKGKSSSVGISRTVLKQLDEAQADAKRMVAALELHFAEDRFSFSPIYSGLQENDLSNLLNGPSHVICKTEDGRSLSPEERNRIKLVLRELGFAEIGILEIDQESEQGVRGQPVTPPRVGD